MFGHKTGCFVLKDLWVRAWLTLSSEGILRGKKKYGMEVRTRKPVVMSRPIHQAPTQRGSPGLSSCSTPAGNRHKTWEWNHLPCFNLSIKRTLGCVQRPHHYLNQFCPRPHRSAARLSPAGSRWRARIQILQTGWLWMIKRLWVSEVSEVLKLKIDDLKNIKTNRYNLRAPN